MKLGPRYLMLAIALALPLVLLFSSLRTLRELEEMRSVYLRNRAANIAAQLEIAAAGSAEFRTTFLENEAGLVDLQVFDPSESTALPEEVSAIAGGHELFRTQEVSIDGENVMRAWVPFHWQGQLRVARIDLSRAAADFLLVHARHNVLVAGVAGALLLLLFAWAFWTERRAARLELRHTELEHLAHLGELSSVLAHEIRNPLGALKGFVQLARERADAETAALLDPVLDETRRLEQLVSDLLLYGRSPEVRLRQLVWPQLAAEIAAFARQQIRDGHVQFETAPTPMAWRTDSDLLKSALLNLVRNAIEAVEGRPAARVRLDAEMGADGSVRLAVEDDGAGFSSAARQRMFEPFFTTKASGTGLGLVITRKLVTTLGGQLRLQMAAGGGTRAEIFFPAAHAAAFEVVHGMDSGHR